MTSSGKRDSVVALGNCGAFPLGDCAGGKEAGLGGGSTRNSAPEAAAAPPTTPRTARPSPVSPVAGGSPAVAVLAAQLAGPGGVAVA